MSNEIFINYYKLKEGASVPDFLVSVENLVNEYASKQKGFVSFNLLVDNDTWADIGIFETMEDAKNLAEKFYSFIEPGSCTSHLFSVERDYQFKSTMPKVVTLVTYKLKKEITASDFLLAVDKAGNRPHSEDSVAVSWKLLVGNDDLWADLLFWESMEGPRRAASSEKRSPELRNYLSMIGEVPFHRHFTVVQSY